MDLLTNMEIAMVHIFHRDVTRIAHDSELEMDTEHDDENVKLLET